MHCMRAALRSRALHWTPAVLACVAVVDGRSQKAFAQPHLSTSVPVEKLACHLRAEDPCANDPLQVQRRSTSTTYDKSCVFLACGSFNPVTMMHLRMFEAARDELFQEGFDVLGGYLSPVHSGYGKTGLAPNDQRLDMARAAVANSDWIMVDDWETSQGDSAAPAVFLLCGEDLLQSFSAPGVWADEDIDGIFGDFGVVCISRPGSNAIDKAVQPDGVLYKYRENLYIVRDVVENPLSSSAVRQAVQEGRSLKYMIPDGVIEIIEEHGLYR